MTQPDLLAAVAEILPVLEDEFGIGEPNEPDDSGVMMGENGDSALTFGHIRKLRRAYDAANQPS